MSFSNLLIPNAFNIYVNKLNEISGTEIKNTNSDGQVLTIVNSVNKEVAFQDPQGGLPPTSEQPSGYVLGILDPIAGTLEWKQDAQGSIPDPLVLSGSDSINKFQVREVGNNPRFTIDTVNDDVKVQEAELRVERTGLPIFTAGDANGVSMRNSGGSPYATFNYASEQVLINGAVDTEKFVVGTNLVPVLTVDTDGQIVLIGGNADISGNTLIQGAQDKDKFIINDGVNKVFGVDTDNAEVYVGSKIITDAPLLTMTSLGKLQMLFQNEIQLESTNNCELKLNVDNTGEAYLRGQQLTIYGFDTLSLTAVNSLVISSPQTSFDATEPIPTIDVLPSQYTDYKEIANKLYVDDRVGGISSGISNSPTAIGNVLGDQSLNPFDFLPNQPTVPPDYLKAGQSYQLIMSGSAVFSNGDAFVFSLKSGAVVLGSISISVPNVAGGGQTWECEADFTIRSITLGLATIVCSFDFTYNDGQDFIGKRSLTTSTTLDTTVANSLEVFVNFSAGQITDNITTQLFILRKIIDV